MSRQEFLSGITEQRVVERMFENVTRASADLAQHIALQQFGFNGKTPKSAIRSRDREGVINEETADALVAAIGFQNVLTHEHRHIDPDEIYKPYRPVYPYTHSQQVT